jgi:hypothetical protein
VTTHQAQAEELLGAMNLLMDDVASYKSAVALLAVNAAIAFNDAVLERLTGNLHKGEDHAAAPKKTRSACGRKKIDISGLKHLEWLVTNKTKFSYSGVVEPSKAQDAAVRARRFSDWAYKNVLKRELENV